MTSEGRDPLTGLLNRRSFDEILNQAVSDGRTFTLAIADVNDFKRVNDRFGMRDANEVLSAVGRGLRSFAGDGAARIGGDEFAVIVDGTDPDLAVNLSRHLSTVADIRYIVGELSTTISTLVGDIAVTVGTATAPAEATEVAGLLEIADRRLGQARKRVREARERAREAQAQRVKEHQRQHPFPQPKPLTRRQSSGSVRMRLAAYIDGTPLDEKSRGTLIAASECLAHLSEHGCSAWEEGE
jgi:diguanylate cyclase (GGDEF)-like protein